MGNRWLEPFEMCTVLTRPRLPLVLSASCCATWRLVGGSRAEIRFFLKQGETVKSHDDCEILNCTCISAGAGRIVPNSANAILARPSRPTPTDRRVRVNLSHSAHVQQDEAPLKKETAESVRVELTGELQPCLGCSIAERLRKPSPSSSVTRAATKGE